MKNTANKNSAKPFDGTTSNLAMTCRAYVVLPTVFSRNFNIIDDKSRCVCCPKVEIFVEMFRAKLYVEIKLIRWTKFEPIHQLSSCSYMYNHRLIEFASSGSCSFLPTLLIFFTGGFWIALGCCLPCSQDRVRHVSALIEMHFYLLLNLVRLELKSASESTQQV